METILHCKTLPEQKAINNNNTPLNSVHTSEGEYASKLVEINTRKYKNRTTTERKEERKRGR